MKIFKYYNRRYSINAQHTLKYMWTMYISHLKGYYHGNM